MSQPNDDFTLTRPQIEAFAAGLYQIAACDEIHEKEVELIREFLTDTGAGELAAKLPVLYFDPAQSYAALESTWLRSLFLQSALLLVQVDGEVSENERDTIGWIARAFNIPGGYDAVAAHVQGASLA